MKFEFFRGEEPTWVLIKKLVGDNRCKIFGLHIGRLFFGTLYEVKQGGFQESDLKLDDADKKVLEELIQNAIEANKSLPAITSTSHLLQLRLKLDLIDMKKE